MIGIIDYEGGNKASVTNALEYLGIKYILARDAGDLERCDGLILPGQGRFGDVMDKLSGMREGLLSQLREGKPYLGICVGLQILFESSEEDPGVPGLGIFKGRIRRFRQGKIPQVGWNMASSSSPLFPKREERFYFVHSYYAISDEEIARTKYGVSYSSAVQKGNIYAVQFHPERSGEAGLELLKNFCEVRRC